jgi:hypothetical protein
MKTATAVFSTSLVALAAFFVTSYPFAAQAELVANYPSGSECQTLIAGQWMDSGEVCVKVEGTDLLVTYNMNTDDNWQLMEAQLWAGKGDDPVAAGMPANKKGNPQIGKFPFPSGDITGQTSYTFTVPLTTFGAAVPEDLCDTSALLAGHAAVRQDNGADGYNTQTGWIDGQQILDGGSWAMFASIDFTCPVMEMAPLPVEPECSNETAFALGEKTFVADSDDLTLKNARWGWQITVPAGDTAKPIVKDIYAGAGQNDLTKGTLVGTLTITRQGDQVNVAYEMFDVATMSETHLYVGTKNVATTAPGKYGHLHELTDASDDEFTVTASNADILYIVAHAATTVCK